MSSQVNCTAGCVQRSSGHDQLKGLNTFQQQFRKLKEKKEIIGSWSLVTGQEGNGNRLNS